MWQKCGGICYEKLRWGKPSIHKAGPAPAIVFTGRSVLSPYPGRQKVAAKNVRIIRFIAIHSIKRNSKLLSRLANQSGVSLQPEGSPDRVVDIQHACVDASL